MGSKGTRKAQTKTREGTGNPPSGNPASSRNLFSRGTEGSASTPCPRDFSARKMEFGGFNKYPKGASIYLDSLPISIRGNVSCLLVTPSFLLPFKIKSAASRRSTKALPNFHSSSVISVPELCEWSSGLRVSAGSSGGWAGAGKEPSSERQGGWRLHHQGLRAAALVIQPQQGGFEPGWAQTIRKTT